MPKKVLALTSNASTVALKQDRVLFYFKANGIQVERVDAISGRCKRVELLAISGLGPVYPQFFLEEKAMIVGSSPEANNHEKVTITFLGGYDDIVAMNDDGLITREALGLDVAPKQSDEPEHSITLDGSPRETGIDHDAPWSTQTEENVLCWGMMPDWLAIMFKKPSAVMESSLDQGKLRIQ